MSSEVSPKQLQEARVKFERIAGLNDSWPRRRVVVEKTPANCLRTGVLARCHPNASYIHVVRDGRDVALSAASEWKGELRGVAGARMSGSGKPRDKFRKLGRVLLEGVKGRIDADGIRSLALVHRDLKRVKRLVRRIALEDSTILWEAPRSRPAGNAGPIRLALHMRVSMGDVCAKGKGWFEAVGAQREKDR